jgi:hypothetical protein
MNGYLDFDGPDAVDFVRMAQILDHMRSHDGIPPRISRVGKMLCFSARRRKRRRLYQQL